MYSRNCIPLRNILLKCSQQSTSTDDFINLATRRLSTHIDYISTIVRKKYQHYPRSVSPVITPPLALPIDHTGQSSDQLLHGINTADIVTESVQSDLAPDLYSPKTELIIPTDPIDLNNYELNVNLNQEKTLIENTEITQTSKLSISPKPPLPPLYPDYPITHINKDLFWFLNWYSLRLPFRFYRYISDSTYSYIRDMIFSYSIEFDFEYCTHDSNDSYDINDSNN